MVSYLKTTNTRVEIMEILKKNILIIDDEELDRYGISTMFKNKGYTNIILAEDGEEGLGLVKNLRPDIIIIDVVLHKIDGFDLCMQIRRIKDYHPLIIMTTGHMEAIIAKKAIKSGADEIVEKQVGFEEIHKTILKLLGSKNQNS